jgi:hypothetical protein
VFSFDEFTLDFGTGWEKWSVIVRMEGWMGVTAILDFEGIK